MGFGFGLFNQSVPIAERTAQWDHLIRTISYLYLLHFNVDLFICSNSGSKIQESDGELGETSDCEDSHVDDGRATSKAKSKRPRIIFSFYI